jgi:lycopene beta-cyclase
MQLIEQLSSLPEWRTKSVALFSDGIPQHRSWCFWATQKHRLHFLVKKTWEKVSFSGENFTVTADVAPYAYHYIPGENFYHYFDATFLRSNPHVAKVKSPVVRVERFDNAFKIVSERAECLASEVFNSMPPLLSDKKSYFLLQQHFKGWFIKTDKNLFDDSTATLMDFSIEQKGDVRFMYFLPFSPTEALVELTVFSPTTYADNVYDEGIEDYIIKRFGKIDYTVEKIEKGRIPMTNALFSRFGNAGEILLGAAAGMVKATTGYAFTRISKDSAQIAEDLHSRRPLLRWARTKGRFRYYDTLLLGILTERPDLGRVIFEALFKKTPMKTIFRFLDEETNLWEEIRLFSRLPIFPFLKQVVKAWFRRG